MFEEQVTTELYLRDVFFMVAGVSVVLAIVGLGFIDAGLSRKKNVLDAWLSKLLAGVALAFGFLFFGYAIWFWQYNQALGVKNAFSQSIKDWWLGGPNFTTFAQFIDPAKVPGADELQVFAVFFITFALLIGAFIHSASLERMKPSALYIMCFAAGLVPWAFVTYLMWGSASPLTNRGVHDYVGIFNGYIFVGAWSVVLNWRLGPRIGAFKPDHRSTGPVPHNLGFVGAGVFILMFTLPFIVLGSGFLFPGVGYWGISLTTSGFGIALINVFVAFIGGGLTGALLTYRTRNPIWALLGPIAGYLSGTALFDITVPWKMLLVSLFGPVFVYGTYKALQAIRIDDPKIGPLTLGAGVYGAIVAGFVGWNVKTGGFFGLEGSYGFQHAEITPWWQIVGVIVTIGISALSAFVLCVALERTIGLRVSEETEIAGLDKGYWGTSAHSDAE